MRRGIAIVVILAVAGTHAGYAYSADGKGSDSRVGGDAYAQEVKQLEQQLRAASLKRDVGFFEKYWAEEYTRTNSFGVVLNKEEALENYRTKALRYERLDFDDERIKSFGDTVVVSARVTVKGKYQDKVLDGKFRHTRVWVRFPDGWKVVAYHASRVEIEDDDEKE